MLMSYIINCVALMMRECQLKLQQYEGTGLTPEQIEQFKAENEKLKSQWVEAMELFNKGE